MIATIAVIAVPWVPEVFFSRATGSCAWVIFIILFTGLLCDNSNSLTYEPRKGQSPTLSRANCVILHLMLAFHSNNSNLNV